MELTIGANIKRLRGIKNITQEQLSVCTYCQFHIVPPLKNSADVCCEHILPQRLNKVKVTSVNNILTQS